MSTKIFLLTLLLMSLLSAMIVTSSAQTRTVGVSPGDWFKGNITVNWSSNDPNATFPPSSYEWLEEMNETDWMLISVLSVSGTNITLQSTSHFKNGNETIESGWLNIDTGEGNMTWMAISANLNANDTLYTSGPISHYTINETLTRTYPDSVRETNLLNMTYEYSWTIDETQYYYYFTENFYWDKAAGILVEDYFGEINQTGEYTTSWSSLYRITESNVWVVPEFPTWTAILIVFVIITAATVLYKRRPIKIWIH